MDIDVVVLSRLQFALTIMFHYLFPPLTIGLGTVLVFLEYRWLRTDDPIYHEAARFWTKMFGINFALGVATGIVMEFEFGTNWAVVLALCGRRVRFGAGGGRHLCLLPGIRLPGRAPVRLGQGQSRVPFLRHLHGRAGQRLFFDLDCGGQFVAADAGGFSHC